MKTICRLRILACAGVALGAIWFASSMDAVASDSNPPYSQAKVIAHVPLSSGAREMFLQQEGKAEYLYVRQLSHEAVTVIDVTEPERPKVVNQVSLENLTMMGFGLVISETPRKSSESGNLPKNW